MKRFVSKIYTSQRTAIFTIGTRFLMLSLGLITSIITARYLGPEGRGIYFYVITTATILAQFGNFGLQSSNTYLVAHDSQLLGRLSSNSLWISICLGVFITSLAIAAFIFLPHAHAPSMSRTSLIALLILVPATIFCLLGNNLLVGINAIRAFNIFQIAPNCLITFLLITASLLHLNLNYFISAYALSWLLSSIGLVIYLGKQQSIPFMFDFTLFMRGFKYALKAYLATLLGFLVLRCNIYILQHYTDSKTLGYFSIATQINDSLAIIPTTIGLLLFPQLIRNTKSRWRQAKQSIFTISIIMVALCVLTALIAKPFVSVLFGKNYLPAIPILLVMLPGAFALGIISIVSQYLSASGFPKQQVGLWGLAFIFVICTSFIFIPKWHGMGAALALSMTYLLLLICLISLAVWMSIKYADEVETENSQATVTVLTAHPISESFRMELEKNSNGKIITLTLSELRKIPLYKVIPKLFSINTPILIALEDSNSLAILPIIKILACFTKSSDINVIHYDKKIIDKVSRRNALWLLFQVATSTLASLGAIIFSRHETGYINQQSRINCVDKRNKNVLYLNANLWFGVKAGGSIGHMAGVINSLQNLGNQVHYASVSEPIMIHPDVMLDHIEPLREFGIPAEFNYYRFNKSVVKQITPLLHQTPFEFIYQRMSVCNYAGVKLSREFNLPLIIEYNGSEVWIARHWGRPLHYEKLAQLAEDICLKHAHLIVTVSNVLKDELVARGIEAERIVSYPNCIDPNIFDPTRFAHDAILQLRQKYQIDSNAIVFTFVGTFGQWHGVEIFAKAIRNLIDQNSAWLIKNKVRFMLVGDGLRMPEVKAILNHPNDNQFVTLTGLIPQIDTPIYLAASDVLVSPHVSNQDGTKFFGSPTKLFEYMAMGKAIIASNLDQIGEVLQNSLHVSDLINANVEPNPSASELAILCQPNSEIELIQAIQFAVENSNWRLALGKNARKEALMKYTWDKHVDVILERLANLYKRTP